MVRKGISKHVTYQELGGGGVGTLIICGLQLPRNRCFDPLGKIWAAIRKRILENFGVDVAGIFIYDDKQGKISCSFCLNYGLIKDGSIPEKLYTLKFEQTFTRQMIMFEETIDAFLLDEVNGYEPYCKLISELSEEDTKPCEAMFNRFLKSIKMRTKKDEKRAAKEAKKAAK